MIAVAESPRRATDPEMRECRRRLREARKGFLPASSQRAFAAALAGRGYVVDWTTIQRWENGSMRIPADYILMVAEVTRLSPNWLLGGSEPKRW